MAGRSTLVVALITGAAAVALPLLIYWPRRSPYVRRVTSIRNGQPRQGMLHLAGLGLAGLALTACGPETAPGCSGPIIPLPTATRQADPDLFSPPAPPAGGSATTPCPAPPAVTPTAAAFPTGFQAGPVTNLALDPAGQDLAATAVGDDMLAVAWLSDGDIYLALARGGAHFQTRRLDAGTAVSVAFSPANRLHVAYAQSGQIYYRAADQGAHPAEAAPILVGPGQSPQVVVDQLNWAHVLFENSGNIYKARHLSGNSWQSQFVTAGGQPRASAFRGGQSSIFGAPAGSYWFGILLTTVQNGQVHVLRFLSWFNLWQETAVFTPPAGEALLGPAGLDYLPAGADTAWTAAAWVTRETAAAPPPAYGQPLFEPVNPLFPDQVANPDQLFSGLNAVRWSSTDTPFAAGLWQQVTVADPNGRLVFSAQGRALADPAAAFTLRLGLDPTGGTTPDAPSVVWSPPGAPGTFAPFNTGAWAAGSTATVFLEATQNSPNRPATAVWDAAVLSNATLANGDFEGPFVPQSTLTVPQGWTAYYADGGSGGGYAPDRYTIYAAWSADGGSNWTPPVIAAENRAPGGNLSGAFRPAVFPLLSTETETPTVSLVAVYEAGDPPPGTDFLRYGRPHISQCALLTAVCSAAPGQALLPRSVVRPALNLVVVPDPFDRARAVLAWDGRQSDYAKRDIYLTTLVLR